MDDRERDRAIVRRRSGLLLREVGVETLAYDAETHEVHVLEAPAAAVFALCDGRRTVADLVRDCRVDGSPVPAEAIELVLAELREAGLLEPGDPPTGLDRRAMLRRLAGGAAVTFGLPLVTSVVAPTPAAAASLAGPVGGGGGGGAGGGGPINAAPVAGDQHVTTPAGSSLVVTLGATDTDGDTLTYRVVTGPSSGTLTGTAPVLTYTPDNGFEGTDTFTFVANDGTVDSAPGTVTIAVTHVNVAPTASIGASTTSGNAPLFVSFTGAGSTDPEGPIASYAWDFGDGGSGSGKTVTHTYAGGTYVAQLTVTDADGATGTTTKTITVHGTTTFSTAGQTGTFTVPPGVTAVTISARGGGGGGGGFTGGSGGSGGRVAISNYAVTPGQVLTTFVGGGGGGGAGQSGRGGGSTSVSTNGSTIIVAGGGGGGGAGTLTGTLGGNGGSGGQSGGAGGNGTSGGAVLGNFGSGGRGGANGTGGLPGGGGLSGASGSAGGNGDGGSGGPVGAAAGGVGSAGTGTGGKGAGGSGGGGYGGGGGGGSNGSSGGGGAGGSRGPAGATFSTAGGSGGSSNGNNPTAGGNGSVTFTY